MLLCEISIIITISIYQKLGLVRPMQQKIKLSLPYEICGLMKKEKNDFKLMLA